MDELADVLTRLLRSRRSGVLLADGDGWVRIDDLRRSASREMRAPVQIEQIRLIAQRQRRFEFTASHLRMQRGRPRPRIPDILFCPVPRRLIARAIDTGIVSPPNAVLNLYTDKSIAWAVAHHMAEPADVLVVDASRARRGDTRFLGTRRPGCFTSTPLPLHDILSLRHGYAEQHSAGGLPVRARPDGSLEVALVQVTRRSGTTWEVAKGKLELGETPTIAAIREIREETGISCPMRVVRELGHIHYGFMAPENRPRLKTIFLYIVAVEGPVEHTLPAHEEGIDAVGWFSPEQAAELVTHASLIPAMAKARDLLLHEGATGLALTPSPRNL